MKRFASFTFLMFIYSWPVLAAPNPAPDPPETEETPQTVPGPASSAQGEAPAQSGKPASVGDLLVALENGSRSSFSDVDFESLVEFHKAEGNQTYASITISFRSDEIRQAAGDGAVAQPFARLSTLNEEAMLYDFTQKNDFADSGVTHSPGLKVFQTGYALPPGRYRLSTGVWVSQGGLAGGRSQEVDVPAFNGAKLALSSVTLASVLERAHGADPTIKQPFIWGSFKVVPRVERSFSRQEPLRLYYQIYNATPDPDSGKPRLVITYTFFQKKDGKFLQAAPPHTLPEQTSQVALYELPVSGWPSGEFKVHIDIRDAVAQESVTGEVFFDLL